MILNHFFEVYLLLCMSIVIHELAHLTAGKIIKLDIKEIHIGDRLYSIHINNLYLSPVMYSSAYVSFYSEDLLEKSLKDIIFFFLAGPFSNLLLMGLAMIKMNSWHMNVLFWINLYLVIENVFPLIKRNDMRKLITYVKKCS